KSTPSPETIQRPPIPLCRPAFLFIGPRTRAEPELLCDPLPRGSALRRLLIELGRDGSRPSPLREAAHDEHVLVGTQAAAHLVPHTNQLGRLGPFAVHLDLATRHGLARERASLEEARGPQPLVDPHSVVVVFHHRENLTKRMTRGGTLSPVVPPWQTSRCDP